jgi:hypothetical protein
LAYFSPSGMSPKKCGNRDNVGKNWKAATVFIETSLLVGV